MLSSAAQAALLAYVLVATGSSIGGHLRFVFGLPLTVAGCGAACLAIRRASRDATPVPQNTIFFALSAMAAVGLAAPSPHGAWWYEVLYRAHPAIALVTIGVCASGGPIWRRRAVWLTVAAATLVAVLAPVAVPKPDIDVWNWVETCARALARGVHPYTVGAVDPHHGAWDYGSTPTVYPYMPLSLLVAAPATLVAGDYRFALALYVPITIALARGAGRRLRVDPAMVDTVTLALALHPRAALLVSLGYLEPLLIATLAAFVWFASRGAEYGEAIAFLLLPSLKQYVLMPVVLLTAIVRIRAFAIGIAVAAATVVPFIVWDWRPTIDGIFYLMRAPIGFRPDSDSISALIWQLFGVHPDRSFAVATQFAVAAVLYPFVRRNGLAGLLLASAVSLLATFLVATQAFFNYYAFAAVMLAFAGLTLAAAQSAANLDDDQTSVASASVWRAGARVRTALDRERGAA
jgi:hypothetical protein